jgi:hypothetical protein
MWVLRKVDIARTIKKLSVSSHICPLRATYPVVDNEYCSDLFFLSLADCCVHLPVSQLLEHWLETPHCPRNRRPPPSAAGDGAIVNGGGTSVNGGGGASVNGCGASDATGDGASDGGGPLHTLLRNLPACLDGVDDLVRLLLEAGADVSCQGRVSPPARTFLPLNIF